MPKKASALLRLMLKQLGYFSPVVSNINGGLLPESIVSGAFLLCLIYGLRGFQGQRKVQGKKLQLGCSEIGYLRGYQ